MMHGRSAWLIPTLLVLTGLFTPGVQRQALSGPSLRSSVTTAAASESSLESELLALTNQNRIRQGLPALELDEKLVRIAREHSAGMAGQGFISHELPSGDLKTRMKLGGYRYVTARENVAAASTVLHAQDALMQSPPHKQNILAMDVYQIGIGIVRCAPPYDKELYITEIFATPREEYPGTAVEETLLSRVADMRKSGAGSLEPDPLLEKLAVDSVSSLTLPIQREELHSLVANSAGELQRTGRTDISRVDVNVQLLRDPQKLSFATPGRQGQDARVFGSAIRQVVDSRDEPAYLVLTLIGFSR